MTEWNAPEYARVPELQKAMAEEALALLQLEQAERVRAASMTTICSDGP
jgi:hypothetical protein